MNDLFHLTNKPIVSIGMFVYNGDRYISDAIDSILSQTFENFELIISDNASTDNTEKICREYANIDSRVRYVRQKENLGAYKNSLYVLDNAQGEFFMWAAHDDCKSADFLEHNVKFLEQNLDYVGSTSPTRFKNGLWNNTNMADGCLAHESSESRFLECLNTWYANGRFYSLFKRSAILKSRVIREGHYLGSDIAFIMELAILGKFNKVDKGYVELGNNGVSGSGKVYRIYRYNFINWLLPMRKFSKEIWKLSSNFSFKSKLLIVIALIKINLMSFLHQIKIEIKRYLSAK